MLNIILGIIAYLLYFLVMVLYVGLPSYEPIDFSSFKKSSPKSIRDALLIMPVLIPTVIILYIITFILLQARLYEKSTEFVDCVYYGLPFYLKKRWIDYATKVETSVCITHFLENSPSELQDVILDESINRKYYINSDQFFSIKDDYSKYRYLTKIGNLKNFQIEDYQKDWICKYKTDWRDKQIDLILDL